MGQQQYCNAFIQPGSDLPFFYYFEQATLITHELIQALHHVEIRWKIICLGKHDAAAFLYSQGTAEQFEQIHRGGIATNDLPC